MFLCPAYHLPAQDSQIIVLQGAGVKAIENELESLHPFQQELVGSMYAPHPSQQRGNFFHFLGIFAHPFAE
jgi:hypothetical protein